MVEKNSTCSRVTTLVKVMHLPVSVDGQPATIQI